MDVLIAVAAIARQPRAIANIVTNDDLFEMAILDQLAQQTQPNGIIRHVDIGVWVVGLLHPEQIEFDDASRIGQFEQPTFVKDRAIDMTKDEAIHRRPARQEEIRHFLRLIFMAPRVDVDGRPRFLLGDERALHACDQRTSEGRSIDRSANGARGRNAPDRGAAGDRERPAQCRSCLVSLNESSPADQPALRL